MMSGSIAEQAAALGISVDAMRERLRQENIALRASGSGTAKEAGKQEPASLAMAAHWLASTLPSAGERVDIPFGIAAPHALANLVAPRRFAFVLPWSALLPDNNRNAVVAGRLMQTPEYRAAKAKAREKIAEQLPGTWSPMAVPVAVRLTLIEPNRSAKRDLLNYQKLICDAMKDLVYLDDSLIDDAHFTRGVPDIDRPRAEITVTPLTTGSLTP